MRNALRAATVAAVTAGSLLSGTGAANAIPTGAGVDECSATSQGEYRTAECLAVTTSGFYKLLVSSSGPATAEVGCSPTPGGGVATTDGNSQGGIYLYLPAGLCTVFVWGEFSSFATLSKY